MGFLAQTILAARNNDYGGWAQLLVFVVLAIFWIVGAINKVKANNVELADDGGEEEEFAKPVEPRRAQPQRRVQRQREVSRRPERQGADAARSGAQRPSQKRGALSTASVERSVKLADKTVAGLGADLPVVDFADPEELRRAILHYEILGKPLSMRG
jgi:hypothetical protein